mmetsp:Transcript_10924/g.33695  ORF Transcript_10924/g.33695 Transcript_10924/m.33695 type:complete len:106 (+) Transcript_10924:2125-2442(+)
MSGEHYQDQGNPPHLRPASQAHVAPAKCTLSPPISLPVQHPQQAQGLPFLTPFPHSLLLEPGQLREEGKLRSVHLMPPRLHASSWASSLFRPSPEGPGSPASRLP